MSVPQPIDIGSPPQLDVPSNTSNPSAATSPPNNSINDDPTAGVPRAGAPLSFTPEKVIGHGSFGTVFLSRVMETGELVAVKKVLQDPRFKNRELQIMLALRPHNNVVSLKTHFMSNGDSETEVYLNLVLEYVPDTLHRFLRTFTRSREFMPITYVKVFSFQLLRALGFLHAKSNGICHRDVKPQNLLIDPNTGMLKICDFGSAKKLIPNEKNVSYICSRYYRAPELVLNNSMYSTAIDIWSAGCVIAEMLLGPPVFCGETSVDQLVEIIKILGTPTREDVDTMNPTYADYKFPSINPVTLDRMFRPHVPRDLADLVKQILVYNPRKRPSAWACLCHPVFNEVRDGGIRLPNGAPLPSLCDFLPEEIESMTAEQHAILVKIN